MRKTPRDIEGAIAERVATDMQKTSWDVAGPPGVGGVMIAVTSAGKIEVAHIPYQDMFMPSLSVHIKRLREMPCIVTRRTPVTLHHCHGGSMKDRWQELGYPGMGQRANPWLQIPLHAELHCFGRFAIDGGIGVERWEMMFGTQVELLNKVNLECPYDLWEEAARWEKTNSK